MRVLHLSTTDTLGGAGRAAHRIHHALMAAGVDSRMSVRVKLGDEWHVRSRPHKFGRFAATLGARSKANSSKILVRPSAPFSTQFLPGDGAAGLRRFAEGIIHLHWICDGFLGVGAIGRITAPIVWTLHDQWPFTGGCHYSSGCEHFIDNCGHCPILRARSETDVSRLVHSAKSRCWKGLNITVVSPSHWMAEKAAQSALFGNRKIHVIPNPVDLQTFRPIPKKQARSQIGLEPSRPILMYGAMSATTDPRKGFDLLEKTLDSLEPNLDRVQLVVIGASETTSPYTGRHRIRFLGRLHDDDAIALAYSAADVFVAPSREDNLPNTVAESLACGTPVAAFRVGGIPDMVRHEHNGFLARPFDTQHLAQGIAALLVKERREQLSAQARAVAKNLFAPQVIATNYRELYQSHITTEGKSSSEEL